MKEKVKNVSCKVSNVFNNTLNFVALKKEIKHLEKELEESKAKEKPYIDTIQVLKSDNRVLKIINTKNEKKIQTLKETIYELEQRQSEFFKE